jgi:hypothetical protein
MTYGGYSIGLYTSMVSKANIDFISLIILSSLLNTIRIARLVVCIFLLNAPVIAAEYQEYEMLN